MGTCLNMLRSIYTWCKLFWCYDIDIRGRCRALYACENTQQNATSQHFPNIHDCSRNYVGRFVRWQNARAASAVNTCYEPATAQATNRSRCSSESANGLHCCCLLPVASFHKCRSQYFCTRLALWQSMAAKKHTTQKARNT